MNSFGIMLHGFQEISNSSKGLGFVTSDDLVKTIVHFGRSRFISPDEWIERTCNGSIRSDSLCLTFDDCLRSQYDFALPVLAKFKLKAFWFINSAPLNQGLNKIDVYREFRLKYFDSVDDYYKVFFDRVIYGDQTFFNSSNYRNFELSYRKMFPFYSSNDIKYRYLRDRILERETYENLVDSLIKDSGLSLSVLAEHLWLSKEQISELAKSGHEIGLHSYSHPTNMDQLSRSDQEQEYSQNYFDLKPIANDLRTAAHPCGSYSLETLTILKDLGIKVAFNSSLSKERPFKEPWMLNLQIPREDIANVEF